MSKEKKKKKKGGKFSKLLTTEQVEKFKSFGKPNLEQDWLEIFTPDMYDDIRTIMKSCSDNQQKAEYIEEEWSDLGFETVGLGTNILTMAHPYYPGVVFKVALDNNGIADNFNDFQLSEVLPRFNRCYARDPNALISVQERLVLPTPYQMDLFMPEILRMLSELSKYFLVADLSPDMRFNYGLTRKGELKIIDGSDLYPLSQMKDKPRCKRITGEHKHTGEPKYCGGKLKYSKDFKYFICTECGARYMTLEMRPKKEVTKMLEMYRDGTTAEERYEMEMAELAAITHEDFMSGPRHANEDETEANEPRTVFVDVDEDDDTSTDLEEQRRGMNADIEDDDLDDEGFMMLKPKNKEVSVDEDEEDEPTSVELPSFEDTSDDTQVVAESPGEDSSVCAAVPADTPSTESTVDSDKPNVSETGDAHSSGGQSITNSPQIKLSYSKTSPNVRLFLNLCDHMRNSKDPVERAIYQGFMELLTDTIKEALSGATGKNQDTPETNPVAGQNEDAGLSTYDKAVKYLTELKSSIDPEDQVQFQNIMDTFCEKPDQPVVENENDNKNNTGVVETRPDEPHVWYHVVNDTCDEDDTQLFPGIFMEISGEDFDEAYDNNGLPFYISFRDDPDTSYKAINAADLKKLMVHAVEDAHYERQVSNGEMDDNGDFIEPEDVENEIPEN